MTVYSLSINATPNPSSGTILVEVTASPTTGVFNSLTRSDANGTRAVRMRTGQAFSDGLLAIHDAEAALAGPVVYTATATTELGLKQQVTKSVTFDGTDVSPRLAVAVMPYKTVPVSVLDYDSTRPTTTTEHQIIGREYPLVSIGVQGTRRGTVGLFATDHAKARDIQAILGTGEIVMLRQPSFAGIDMYFTATATRVTPMSENTAVRHWLVQIDYIEVAAPSGPLYGSGGWTYGTSLAHNATFAESRAEFPTYADLTVGPEEWL